MQTKSPPRLAAEALAFFLDFDGTLVPFDKPDETVPLVDDGLRSLLTELRNRADGALAMVSGRSIEVIDSLFEPLRLAAAGEHGAEWRFTPHATREQLVPPPGLVTAHAAHGARRLRAIRQPHARRAFRAQGLVDGAALPSSS